MLISIACEHDGEPLQGIITSPPGPGRHPTVVIFHSGRGIDALMRRRAQQLAGLGYMAVVPDMFGGGVTHEKRSDEKGSRSILSDPHAVRARIGLWMHRIKQEAAVDGSNMAAIGFCFGGYCALELARTGADMKFVVSYHGTLKTRLPAAPGTIKTEVIAYCGDRDPFAPIADIDALRAEMSAAEAHYQITVFGDTAHAFTDPAAAEINQTGVEYNEMADRMSWAGTVTLLDALMSIRQPVA